MKLPNERLDEKVMEEVIKIDKRKLLEMVLNWRWSKKSPPKKRAQKSLVKMIRAEVATKEERAEVAEDESSHWCCQNPKYSSQRYGTW